MTDLAKDNKKVREAGMSYGKWRALQEEHQASVKRKKRKQHLVTSSGFDITLFCKLYNLGLNDKEIAQQMGNCAKTVYLFRKHNNIAQNNVKSETLNARKKLKPESFIVPAQ